MFQASLESWYQQNWRYPVKFKAKRWICKLTCILLFPSFLLCPLLSAPQPFTVQILLPSPQLDFQTMPHLNRWHHQTSTSLSWYVLPWLLQLPTLWPASKQTMASSVYLICCCQSYPPYQPFTSRSVSHHLSDNLSLASVHPSNQIQNTNNIKSHPQLCP